jgi:CRISPR/Cas system-associated protein endoribonuclease Cas2
MAPVIHVLTNGAITSRRAAQRHLAPEGSIILFEITDKQFGMMEFYRGKSATLPPGTPQQLELF